MLIFCSLSPLPPASPLRNHCKKRKLSIHPTPLQLCHTIGMILSLRDCTYILHYRSARATEGEESLLCLRLLCILPPRPPESRLHHDYYLHHHPKRQAAWWCLQTSGQGDSGHVKTKDRFRRHFSLLLLPLSFVVFVEDHCQACFPEPNCHQVSFSGSSLRKARGKEGR